MASASQERLRHARGERREGLASLSARTGLRVHHIRAIEEGRFGDLPAGIYGRAAVRTFATAFALDADAVLADCEDLLPRVEDPIDALARARGIARHNPGASVDVIPRPAAAASLRLRPFAAATVDGAFTGVLLLAASGAAALLARVSIAALTSATVPLFLVGVILAAAYYVWLGGLSGTTFGEYAVGGEAFDRDPRPLTLRAIARRTLAAATADARAMHASGRWIGRRLRLPGGRSVRPPAPLPSPPPPRDREEALTWSMSPRASVPPPRLRRRHG